MLKKAVYYIINTISVLIIAAALFILLSVVLTKKNDVPNILGYSAFRVITQSMEPNIAEGDMIIVKRDCGDLSVGDVITFYSSDPQLHGAINTHRITEIHTENDMCVFTTKGDANVVADSYPVSEESLIGKVVFSSKLLGTLSKLASNPLVFVPLIMVPLLALLLSNMIKTIRLAKEAVKAEEEQAVAEVLQQLQLQKENNISDKSEEPPQIEEP